MQSKSHETIPLKSGPCGKQTINLMRYCMQVPVVDTDKCQERYDRLDVTIGKQHAYNLYSFLRNDIKVPESCMKKIILAPFQNLPLIKLIKILPRTFKF
jgi:DUF1365 family protein